MKTKRYRTSPKRSTPGTRTYQGKLDSKKRMVIRGARYTHYEVLEEPNGNVHLIPKRLVDIEPIPRRVLAQIERSMKNLDNGKAFGPVDLSTFPKPARKRPK